MRLSVQLYTLRDELQSDPLATMRAVRDIGFDFVELAGDFGISDDGWRSLLADLGLKASGAHVPLESFEADPDAALADAKLFGGPYVIVPYVSPEVLRTELDALKARIAAAAARLSGTGISLLYHNHAHEMEEVGGQSILETLLEGTDPETVGVEMDVAWVQIGGKEPAAFMDHLGGRVRLLHLKDYRGSGDDLAWVPAGEGEVDFGPILESAQRLGVAYGAIELDSSRDLPPLEAVKRSYDYFRSKGLG